MSSKKARLQQGLVFVLSGPSGSGKTTLAQKALEDPELGKRLVRSVSFTTRVRRSGEKNGRDYVFISEDVFNRKRREKKILEWTKYLGYYYATSSEFIDKQRARGKHVILCLDFRGARKIKRVYPRDAVAIFIAPPSLNVLRKRIVARCSRTPAQEIERRVRMAAQELGNAAWYDYRVLNKDLPDAVDRIEKIIVREEKRRAE